MRKTRKWAGIRNTVVALGFALATTSAGVAHANLITASTTPVLSYDTVGSTISNVGVTGTPVISFTPTSGGSFLAPSSLSLGSFVAAADPSGQSTTYANTPFNITFNADSLNGGAVQPNGTPVTLSGLLNGTISGNNQSSVVASFNGFNTPTFSTGLYSNTLTAPSSALSIVPSTSNGGVSTLQVSLNSTATAIPLPEPSTFVVFGAAILGLGLSRRRKS